MKRTAALLAALAMAAACGRRLPNQPGIPDGGNGSPTFSRTVLLELFTASWCTNCPKADSAADLVAEGMGDSAIIVEYHPINGAPADPMGFAESQQRGDYYGVSGWPVLRIDGIDSVLSAPDVPSTYAQYRARASGRLAAKSPVRIQLLGGINNGQLAYQATVIADSTLRAGDIRLLALVIEDSVLYNGVHYRKVVRRLEPNAQGASLVLLPSSVTTRSGNVPLDPGWQTGRIWLAALVQNFQTREVLQSAQLRPTRPPFAYALTVPDTFASVTVDTFVSYNFTVKHLGTMPDTILIDLPDSLTNFPADLERIICDQYGMCFPLPHKVFMAPGDSVSTLVVHLRSFFPSTYRTELILQSVSDRAVVRRQGLVLEVTL